MEESIRREATLELAHTTLPTVAVYPLLIFLCAAASRFGAEQPVGVGCAVLCSLLAGLWRLSLSRSILGQEGDIPAALTHRYRLSTLLVGAIWGSFAASAAYLYGAGWASQLAQVVTVGLVSGATTTLVSDVVLFRIYTLLMIAPSTLVLAGLHGQEAWSSLVLGVFAVFIVLSSRVNSARYWTALRNHWMLQEKTRDLERVSRAKGEFLATMSHEIRTPMNAIFGLTELLLHSELSGSQRNWVESLHASCEALLGIISDVLDLSKIEAGRLELEQAPYDLRACLQSIVTLFEPAAQEKGLHLQGDLSPLGEACWVLGDRTRLRQIITNLLSNSIKFTSQGSVSLSLSLHLQADPPWLQIVLRDTGVGIAADKMDRMFQPFSQSDASITREFGGTGLGLVVCSSLSQLMGAQVWVVSGSALAGRVPDDFVLQPIQPGAAFYLRLPLVLVTAPAVAVEQTPSRSLLPPRDRRILLAEDNAVNQKVALAILTRLGYQVVVAGNGLEAIEACLNSPFDIIFMDLQMPQLDGLSATQRLRTMSLRPQPWIVALTANAFREDQERCAAAGMNDFLSKPVRESDFIRALVRFALSLKSTKENQDS